MFARSAAPVPSSLRLALIPLLLSAFLLVLAPPGAASARQVTEELTAADRELLVKVRLAGLWEGPISAQAAERGATAKVRDVGGHLAEEHGVLDGKVQQAAAKVGVALPSEPTAQQKGWMDQITGQSGMEYDRTYANLARAAHGTVFPLVANVRATTRNDTVREFAQAAVTAVQRHMTLLESTGLVRPDALVVPPAPTPAVTNANAVVADASAAPDSLGFGEILLGLLAGVFGVAATLGLVRWLGAYRRGGL